jgi:ketosteroid isomerase-like protein
VLCFIRGRGAERGCIPSRDRKGAVSLDTHLTPQFLKTRIGETGIFAVTLKVQHHLRLIVITALEIFDSPYRDRVISAGPVDLRFRQTGRTAASHWAMVWTFQAGKAVHFQEYADTVALEEVQTPRE